MRDRVLLRVVDGTIRCDVPDSYIYELEVRGGKLYASTITEQQEEPLEDYVEYQDDIDVRELTEIFNDKRN